MVRRSSSLAKPSVHGSVSMRLASWARWAVMSAYNKANGLWCAENSYLLTDTLRKRWGFRGFVISDWGSTYSTEGTINAGMGLEMPGGERMRIWANKPETKRDGNGAGWL